MQPNPDPELPGDGSPNELEEAQRKLQAALLHPTAPPPSLTIPTPPERSSITYEAAAMDLLETLVLRVDQVAKTSAEQFSRVESTNEQMVATMQLAQVMIAQQDRLQTQVTDGINRQETITLALTKINANLTELVAALVAPRQGA